MGLGQALRQPSVWILALGILATNTGGYAMGFWLPTFIENMLKAPAVTNAAVTAVAQIGSPAGDGPLIGTATLAGGLATPTNALRFLGFVYLLGLAGVIISGQSSDRTGERKWHCVAGQVGAGVFLMISLIPGQPFWLVMVWLCGMGFFAQFWPSPFWVLPTMSMSASAAAVSIGFINICANVGGMLGSPIVGKMKATGFEDVHCMILLACCYALGGVIIACLVVKRKAS
jgi:ACS family tartrate transporter-like MFS transporter